MAEPYVPSPAWRASLDDGVLVVSAGADLSYAVEDLDEASAVELVAAWGRQAFRADELSTRARETVAELVEVGAVRHTAESRPTKAVGVRFVGTSDARLEQRLQAEMGESPALRPSQDDCELLLVVRASGRLVELYEGAVPEAVPHLLVDVAYHHTISLGPLVVAGETACLACLAGRIGMHWGDPPPPERPVVCESPGLVAALAARELEAIARGDLRLANATVAYDVDAHRVSACPVYRLPWCSACGDGAAAPRGDVDLPWVGAA